MIPVRGIELNVEYTEEYETKEVAIDYISEIIERFFEPSMYIIVRHDCPSDREENQDEESDYDEYE